LSRKRAPALPLHLGVKAVIFALLTCNAAIYLFTGTLRQALDATAWLTLLALFTLETGFPERMRGRHTSMIVRGTRLAAAAAVCTAAIGYAYKNEWLDAVNTCIWIAVVALLEIEVRYPLGVARYRKWYAATAVTLYTGLAALVLMWTWRREWFDAYDAVLWLAAFAMIDMDVLRISRKNGAV
jgi:hypothetical protein